MNNLVSKLAILGPLGCPVFAGTPHQFPELMAGLLAR